MGVVRRSKYEIRTGENFLDGTSRERRYEPGDRLGTYLFFLFVLWISPRSRGLTLKHFPNLRKAL